MRGSTTTTYAATPQAPLGERTGSTLLLYLRDLHGDILGTVQAGQTTPSSRAYQDPWGELSWSGTAPLLGFQSQLTDPATGAVATPARWYLPALSRFMAPDPLEGDPALPTSLNRLAYALDDPITLADPTGLRPSCEDCTPQDYEEVVGDWAQARVQAASSGTGAYQVGRIEHGDGNALAGLNAAGLYMGYQRFGPVVRYMPVAVRAAREFGVDPRLLMAIVLMEGEGRQRWELAAEDLERLQVLAGDPSPSIGIVQMQLGVFKETTLGHIDRFGLPSGASSEIGWRVAYLSRLQREGLAIRYAAAHLSDLRSAMRPGDRDDPSLVAAAYQAGLGAYRDLYLASGTFGPRAEVYRSTFRRVLVIVEGMVAL